MGNKSPNYSCSNNTITIALRVLDCDTISQVKGKILNAIYKNSPYSSRLNANDVELSLRQQQPLAPTGANQFVVVTLNDEDYSSVTNFNGMKRINTLRHYGVTDQAIMMLNRTRNQSDSQVSSRATRTNLTDILDEHYNNPYSEIQYGQMGRLEAPTRSSCDQSSTQQQQQQHARSSRSWHLVRSDDRNHISSDVCHSNDSSPLSHSPSMLLLGGENPSHQHHMTTRLRQPVVAAGQQQYYHPSSSSTSSSGNVMDTNSTSANSSSINVTHIAGRQRVPEQQPIYCQIGSISGRSQHTGAGGNSNYYCQIGADYHQANGGHPVETMQRQQYRQRQIDREQENQIYLSRMLASKGTVQNYIDEFFKSILSARPSTHDSVQGEDGNFGAILCGDATTSRRGLPATHACPPAVKWLFDLLDDAAEENGITDQNVIHSWKSNAFLLRFWMNFIKNPNYILDVEKSNTLDASLSTIAQTLMDSCTTNELKPNQVSQICINLLKLLINIDVDSWLLAKIYISSE